ncbi:MAG: NERD domain-containing protein, partial [Actinomycetes bacterium]
YRAWSSFEFMSGQGGWSEVDCLVVATHAIFLIEIKSWRGELTGGKVEWQVPRGSETNPLISTNAKARKLAGLLKETKALKGKRVPRVEALVFFSEEDFKCRIDMDARDRLTGIDQSKVPDSNQGGGLPGVVHYLENWNTRDSINSELSELIAKAVDELEIRPYGRYRQIGPAVLDFNHKLADTPDALEFAAHHDGGTGSGHYRVLFHKPIPTDQDDGTRRAATAAKREFDLLFPEETHHIGLAKPVEVDIDHPWGAAVVYRASSESRPLDQSLDEEGSVLTDEQRIDLLRRLIEAVRHAHSRNMYHRSLRPKAVLVNRAFEGYWQPVVTGWHTGLRIEADLGVVEGTQHLPSFDPDLARYEAPEARDAADPDPEKLDVFALGALSYLILTGVPPSLDLRAALEAGGGSLDPAADDPEINEDLSEVVASATALQPDQRVGTVDELLEFLVMADEGPLPTTEPATSSPVVALPAPGPDVSLPQLAPAMISRGDRVGSFTVTHRMATGSTAIAWRAVHDDGRQGVLKVAIEKENNSQLEAEGILLAKLRTHTVVELLDGPVDLGGRTAIFLKEAERGTLRAELASGDARSLQQVASWGIDLLGALDHLERLGVFHRDIKPDNVGLTQAGDSEQALLFDFSLADAPLDDLRLGTRGYSDPFLASDPGRASYDAYADRYSAAVVLHELLTGTRPVWGDGKTSPSEAAGALNLNEEQFPEACGEALVAFFNRAMSPSAADRFDSARAMTRAWEDAVVPVSEAQPDSPEPADGGTRRVGAVAGIAAGAVGLVSGALAAPVGVPALVVVGTGSAIRIAYKKRKSRVTEGEIEAVKSALSEVPPEQVLFDPARKRWQVVPSAESAALVRRLAELPDVEVRESAEKLIELGDTNSENQSTPAGDGAESGQVLELGQFQLDCTPKVEAFVGTTPGGESGQPGERFIYEVEGPDGVVLGVADERFVNGERQIRVHDAADSGPRFDRLERGLRLGVLRHPDGRQIILEQARMNDGDWAKKYKASRDELDAGARVDVFSVLTTLGATKIGTRADLAADKSVHKHKLCAIFPVSAELLPVAAYVMTRVAPIYLRIPG